MDQHSKEWVVLEKVALASVKEQRKSRRWGIFFKLLTFTYLFAAVALFVSKSGDLPAVSQLNTAHSALVRLDGLIMAQEESDANLIVAGLRNAFEAEASTAVILAINSPGGSPVHAGYVYDEIVRLRCLYPDKKVYAVISDLGASAAYYIAAAADEIYADKASLVGSIGVISSSFGFTELMQKLGIERRVLTAGNNKAFLDPYQPWKEDDKAFWKASLAVIHQQFIDQVKKGRGDRLPANSDVFSGLVWTGEEALDNGLIDGLGSVGFVARDIIGADDIVDYSFRRDPFEEFARQFGLSAGVGIAKQLQLDALLPKIQ